MLTNKHRNTGGHLPGEYTSQHPSSSTSHHHRRRRQPHLSRWSGAPCRACLLGWPPRGLCPCHAPHLPAFLPSGLLSSPGRHRHHAGRRRGLPHSHLGCPGTSRAVRPHPVRQHCMENHGGCQTNGAVPSLLSTRPGTPGSVNSSWWTCRSSRSGL